MIVDVIDSGIGIPQEKLDTIFDPFCQADNSVTREFGGTGLGLTISRRIAQTLGGALEFESEPGRGSMFTLKIAAGPLAPNVLRDRAPLTDGLAICAASPITEPSHLSSRVLVVDDGDTNRRLVRLLLGKKGASVSEAVDGQDAIEKVSKEEFDLILMDMQMPVMDGYQATRRLREQGVKIPIIALTAHAMSNDRDKCLQAGCTTYLSKPIDPVELCSCYVWLHIVYSH